MKEQSFQTDTSELTLKNVFCETNKALLESPKPSLFFEELNRSGRISDFFPELDSLHGVPQDTEHHPEGDVWTHTMIVVDRAAECRDSASYPLGFMYAALFHDLGKAVTTKYDEEKEKWRSVGHAEAGIPLARSALARMTDEKHLTDYVENMVAMHMQPHMVQENSAVKRTNRMFDKCVAPKDLILLAGCDAMLPDAIDHKLIRSGWWDARLEQYEQTKKTPEVTRQDLICLGYTPGPEFEMILDKCHDIHLAEVDRTTVLKQLPNIVKGIRNGRKTDTIEEMIEQAGQECKRDGKEEIGDTVDRE